MLMMLALLWHFIGLLAPEAPKTLISMLLNQVLEELLTPLTILIPDSILSRGDGTGGAGDAIAPLAFKISL